MSKAKPLLVESRWNFQIQCSGDDEDRQQFSISLFRRGAQLRVAFSIHGDGPGVENIDVAMVDAIREAAELVKRHVKASDLHEQLE